MLTKRGYYDILDRIFDTGGLSPDMEEDLLKLKADYDEREGMLRKYGEVYDGEDKDEYEYREYKNDTTDWKAKYMEMRDRYRIRFRDYSGSSNDSYVAEGVNDLVETPPENTVKSLEELL